MLGRNTVKGFDKKWGESNHPSHVANTFIQHTAQVNDAVFLAHEFTFFQANKPPSLLLEGGTCHVVAVVAQSCQSDFERASTGLLS